MSRISFFLNYPDKRGAGLYFATTPLYSEFKLLGEDVSIVATHEVAAAAKGKELWLNDLISIRIPTLFKIFKKYRETPTILHLHGMWGVHSLAVFLLSYLPNVKVVISPHGMLDSWAVKQSSFKKKIARILYEDRLWKRANCFHALNENESLEIKSLVPNAKIVIIPNGVNLPSYTRSCINETKKLLFLGRIDNKKGINELLAAWELKHNYYKNIELHIAGSGNEEIEKKIRFLHDKRVLTYHGAVYGDEKSALYKSCDAFILPSFSEGLPMTVLEAMSFGMIPFISQQCNMPEVLEKELGIDVSPCESSIITAFEKLTSFTDSYMLSLSPEIKSYVGVNYSWDAIAYQHLDNYKKIAKG